MSKLKFHRLKKKKKSRDAQSSRLYKLANTSLSGQLSVITRVYNVGRNLARDAFEKKKKSIPRNLLLVLMLVACLGAHYHAKMHIFI